MMLPVAFRGIDTLRSAIRSQPRKQARHVVRIVVVLRKRTAEISLFRRDYRHINQNKCQKHDGHYPPTACRNRETRREEERAQIQGITRVSVWAAGSELLIFLHMTGSEGAQDQARNHDQRAGDQRGSSWPGEPNEKRGR